MANTTIYFNPKCSKCRETMALLNDNNIEPDVVEYLKRPPSKEDITRIINMGIPAKELVRTHEEAWKALNIDVNSASDEEIIDALVNTHQALQRPIVVANGKAILGRPPEKVLEIL